MIQFRSDVQVDLIQHAGSDEMIARAARVSTGKDLIEGQKIEGRLRTPIARETQAQILVFACF